jgi:hypothetical protein
MDVIDGNASQLLETKLIGDSECLCGTPIPFGAVAGLIWIKLPAATCRRGSFETLARHSRFAHAHFLTLNAHPLRR